MARNTAYRCCSCKSIVEPGVISYSQGQPPRRVVRGDPFRSTTPATAAATAAVIASIRRRKRRHVRRIMTTTLYSTVSFYLHFRSTIIPPVFSAVQAAPVAVNFGGGCPNVCNEHGYCAEPSTEKCSCHQGWASADCSIRLCPSGNAWVDYPTANNTAHAALTECSNMGVCNRSSGRCSCRSGFTGEACQRLTCADNCNGRGRCMSMRDAAAVVDGDSLEFEAVYEGWDADMIHGCLCDDGWEGHDCSLRSCPRGIDPYPNATGVPEEQLIDCYCPGHCSGSLRLGFRGHSTRPIPHDASAELVKYRLEELDTVDQVSVNITGPGMMICNGSQGATTRVTFLLQYGSLSNMTGDLATLASTATGAPYVSLFSKGQASDINPHLWSQTGTQHAQECSGRGYCNRFTGHCLCYSRYTSSDGQGGSGDPGDCGYFDWSDPPTNCTTATPVWGSTEALCSGAGDCDYDTLSCNCTTGYAGGACELKSCDSGVAWFEEAAWNMTSDAEGGRTGLSVQCSAGGVCNEVTGVCDCHADIFAGAACEVMACPTCSDVGQCQDMEYFAATAMVNGEVTPYTYDLWDANKMRSCWCNRTMAVDNTFSGTSETYRGPYALADTDSYGYDCSLARCPTGDNSHTDGTTDIQRVNCSGISGVFSLSFRDAWTTELDFDINAEDLETALEATPWIFDVEVTFSSGTSACNDTEYIDIEFVTENGDLPLIKSDVAFLLRDDVGTRGEVLVAKIQTGTREDVECAAHGICAEEEGVCDCFVGYQSSDGAGSIGERGDCGWRNKYQTALFSSEGMSNDYN